MTDEALFAAALELPPDQRQRYLEEACAGDAVLLKQVLTLLAGHEHVAGILDQQAGTNTAAYERAGPAEPELPVGAVVAGRYKLLECLGEGGMGMVYVAEQIEPVRRKVALKVVKAGMDSKKVLGRFEAERQALAMMDHPNIARVLDGGLTEQGRPYFAMEYIKGVPLTEYCDAARLNVRERLDLFIAVCQAVQHAHLKGILHRDLKPSNILVALYDGRPVPKVIDFGLAKAMYQPLTEHSVYTGHQIVLGTPLYMSPEQSELNNLDVDTRTDIYSLGVILYELLTGATPLDRQRFQQAAWEEILRLIRDEEPSKPSTKLSGSAALPSVAAQRKTEPAKLSKLIRGDLDWITMKALEKDRNRRYETANGFARDIQRHLDDEAVEACPPSVGYRVRKFVRRHRPGVAAAVGIALALAVAVGGLTVGMVRARDAEAEARKERRNSDMQRFRADQNFVRARQAVDRYLQKVAESPALRRGNLVELRKQLLMEAVPFLEEFVREKHDDWLVRCEQGLACMRLAMVQSEMGEHDAAVRDYTVARDIYRELVAANPPYEKNRYKLAAVLNNLGNNLLRLDKKGEAEDAYKESIRVKEQLVADYPAEAEYQRFLSVGYHNMASMLGDFGKTAEAEALYRKALAMREQLVAQDVKDVDCRYDLALTCQGLGQLLHAHGNPAEGAALLRQSLTVRQKLVADHPQERLFRHDLARSYAMLGRVLADDGQRAEAESLLRQSLGIYDQFAADFSLAPQYRDEFARTTNRLGRLLADSNQFADAESTFRQAIALREKLASDFPKLPEYRVALAHDLADLAALYAKWSKPAESEALYRQALAQSEKLTADYPAVASHHISAARLCTLIGERFSKPEAPAAPIDMHTKAIDHLETARTQEPEKTATRSLLRNAHSARAGALVKQSRHADAIGDWDRALALDDGERREFLTVRRALCLAQSGDHARAVAAVEDLTTDRQPAGATLYDAACVLAVTAEALKSETHAAHAVALLRRAQAAGFFADAKRIEHVQSDSDLAALRPREDFQKFVADLKANPGR